jgi:hypothetical protein
MDEDERGEKMTNIEEYRRKWLRREDVKKVGREETRYEVKK